MPSTCDSGSAPRRPRRGAAARRRRFVGGTRSSVEMHEQSTLERSRWVLELTTALSAAVTPRQVASAVSRAGLVAMGAATAHLFWHRGGEGLEHVASLGDGPRSAEAAPAVFHARLLAAEADRTGAPVWSDELAAVPVVVNGATVAVLGVGYACPRSFGPDDRSLLLAIATQCGQALHRSTLFAGEAESRRRANAAEERLKRTLERVALADDLAAALADARTEAEAAWVVFDEAAEMLGAVASVVTRRTADDELE